MQLFHLPHHCSLCDVPTTVTACAIRINVDSRTHRITAQATDPDTATIYNCQVHALINPSNLEMEPEFYEYLVL